MLLMGLANAQTGSPTLAALETTYSDAAVGDVPLLAPKSLATATADYKQALIAAAEDPLSEGSVAAANSALNAIAAAQTNADQVRPLLANLLQKRSLAEAANSASLAPKPWNAAEKQLVKLTSDIERGKLSAQVARQQRSGRVFALYDEAELEALTNALLARPREARALALVGKANKLASITFNSGDDALQASSDALQQQRYDNATAAALANAAEQRFAHATQLTLVAQQLKSKQLTTEQLLLLWESRLLQINTAAGLEYDPLGGWDATTDTLATYIAETKQNLANLQALLAESRSYTGSLEDELRLADERLGGTLAERDELILIQEQQARSRERLMQLEELFEPSEAAVLQERGNIILRLSGLQFASGSSKLDNNAIELLAKVQKALAVYPD